MYYFRAFIAGIVVPSILLPIVLCVAIAAHKPELLGVKFFHMIPIVWGIWNMLYFGFFKTALPWSVDTRLMVTGAVLGLLIAVYGVFGLGLPAMLGIPHAYTYAPLVVAPVLYAIFWRYLVKPLNGILGLPEG